MKQTMKQKIKDEDINYILFLCHIGAIREYYFMFKDSIRHQDKMICNNAMKALNQLFREYDRKKVDNLKAYTDISEEILSHNERIFEHIKKSINNE